MKIAVLPRGYPSPENKYSYAFVHRRTANYPPEHDTRVFLPTSRLGLDYEYEDVPVSVRSAEKVVSELIEFDPDGLFVHAPVGRHLAGDHDVFDVVEEVNAAIETTVVTTLQGFESTLRLLYRPNEILEELQRGLGPSLSRAKNEVFQNLNNVYQLYRLRDYLRERERAGDPTVFLSNWLRNAVSNSVRIDFDHGHVIPNPVDDEVFSFSPPNPEQVTDLLSVKSFNAHHYANDVSIRTVAHLDDFHLDLYGDGRLFDWCQSLSKDLDANVTFHRRFLTHEEIAQLHREHGVFMSPSRADSQGVSACEAMSSGMPVISSPIGGVPEFVVHEETGFLCDTPEEMAERLEWLRANPDEFVEMGHTASETIQEKCGLDTIIERDMGLIEA